MTSVFVSHSSLDYDLVGNRIVEPLQSRGLEVWYSRDSIHAAEEWEKRIRQALTGCEWFLVALSANSVRSEWVRAEVDWALEHRLGRLVPVLIDDCDPQECNLRLRTLQYIDLRRNDLQSQAALLRVWDLQPPAAAPPAGRKWPLHPLAAAAIILAVAICGWLVARPRPPPDKSPAAFPANHAQAPPTAAAAVSPVAVAPHAAVRSEATGAATAPSAPTSDAASPPMLIDLGLARPLERRPDVPEPAPSADPRVSYHFQRKDSALCIGFSAPYVELQRAGKAIAGLNVDFAPFSLEIPTLSAKVLNNSGQSAMITECVAEVVASQIDERPVLVVADRSIECLEFFDEGWGPVVDPLLSFTLRPGRRQGAAEPPAVHPPPLKLETFDERCAVRLTKYIPKSLQDEPFLLASGELEFGPADQRQRVPFSTSVIFEITPGSPLAPSCVYDLKLTAGKAPDVVRVPAEQFMKGGEPDHFLLRVISDKSAHYELRVGFRLIDGRELSGQKVILDLFVPRTQAKRLAKALAKQSAP
jgi:hypothetical protein